jgi:hypothetical protein
MMDSTQRLARPLLAPGQAQKELLHNEALQLLDIAVAASVEGPPQNEPPAAAAIGSAYLVGDAPTAEWNGYAAHIAGYGAGGWRFVSPRAGMAAFVKSTQTIAVYSGATWEIGSIRGSTVILDGLQVVGPRTGPIAEPAGGTVIDTEARFALAEILGTLRQHGLISS